MLRDRPDAIQLAGSAMAKRYVTSITICGNISVKEGKSGLLKVTVTARIRHRLPMSQSYSENLDPITIMLIYSAAATARALT